MTTDQKGRQRRRGLVRYLIRHSYFKNVSIARTILRHLRAFSFALETVVLLYLLAVTPAIFLGFMLRGTLASFPTLVRDPAKASIGMIILCTLVPTLIGSRMRYPANIVAPCIFILLLYAMKVMSDGPRINLISFNDTPAYDYVWLSWPFLLFVLFVQIALLSVSLLPRAATN